MICLMSVLLEFVRLRLAAGVRVPCHILQIPTLVGRGDRVLVNEFLNCPPRLGHSFHLGTLALRSSLFGRY